jgi:hypothetical protein
MGFLSRSKVVGLYKAHSCFGGYEYFASQLTAAKYLKHIYKAKREFGFILAWSATSVIVEAICGSELYAEIADKAVGSVQKPDVQVNYTPIFTTQRNYVSVYIWDAANIWVRPEVTSCLLPSGEFDIKLVRQAVEVERERYSKYHIGTMQAILHFKETAEPVLPHWYPTASSLSRNGYRILPACS